MVPASRLSVAAASVALAAGVLAAIPAPAAERTVRLVAGNRFEPSERFIRVGDTIRWFYDDDTDVYHSVTSSPESAEQFDSSPNDCPPPEPPNPLDPDGDCLSRGNRVFRHRFDEAGDFPYYCRTHGTKMTGVIRVRGAGEPTSPSPTATSSPSPTATASPSPTRSPSPSPGATISPTGSPSPTPTASVFAAPRSGDDGGRAGPIVAALLALAGLSGAAVAVYRRFVRPG